MKRASAVLSSVAALLVAAGAQSADSKLVPAGFCSAEYPAGTLFQSVRVTEFFEVVSAGVLGHVNMACPFIRDRLSEDLESFVAYFERIEVDSTPPDGLPSGGVDCQLFATNPLDGGDYDEVSKEFSDVFGGSNVSLTFDVSGLDASNDRTYTLWCELDEGDIFGGVLYSEL
ncbi:MAG TPA: hypothetical protein VF989_13625 [Polyangiaceae bacterium]